MRETPQVAPPAKPPGRNEPCWCGSGKKYKKCHLRADQGQIAQVVPTGRGFPNLFRRQPAPKPPRLKTPEQIEGIRRAGQLARRLLDELEERIVPGITTEEIDDWVVELTRVAGATSAPLGYRGFPKSTCTSVNEVVCHGIPGPLVLRAGDIVNVDVTPVLDGFYGDSNRMFLVGEVSEEARRLVTVTRECLELGIDQVRPGGRIGDIGHAIQTHAEAHGYSVVRQFGGHGVGLQFHEEPHVPHYGKAGTGTLLQPGMVFTIEPMINEGNWRVRVLPDGWTAMTVDGRLSAQFEHTVAVSSDGVDVLTL
jgi:methionyl aminopeptidase